MASINFIRVGFAVSIFAIASINSSAVAQEIDPKSPLGQAEKSMYIMNKVYQYYLIHNLPHKGGSYLKAGVGYIQIQSAKLGIPAEQLVSMAGLGGPTYWKVLQEQAAAVPASALAPPSSTDSQGMECLGAPDGDISCFPR